MECQLLGFFLLILSVAILKMYLLIYPTILLCNTRTDGKLIDGKNMRRGNFNIIEIVDGNYSAKII